MRPGIKYSCDLGVVSEIKAQLKEPISFISPKYHWHNLLGAFGDCNNEIDYCHLWFERGEPLAIFCGYTRKG
jgi:hypothetical protein